MLCSVTTSSNLLTCSVCLSLCQTFLSKCPCFSFAIKAVGLWKPDLRCGKLMRHLLHIGIVHQEPLGDSLLNCLNLTHKISLPELLLNLTQLNCALSKERHITFSSPLTKGREDGIKFWIYSSSYPFLSGASGSSRIPLGIPPLHCCTRAENSD